MNRTKDKGITLIALIVTIVILLILAGMTINLLTGNNGLITRAKQAADETKYANAAEKIKLAVNASYDETGIISDEKLKKNLNNIDGINEQIVEITYDLTVIVDGYKFSIKNTGEIVSLGKMNNLPEDPSETNVESTVLYPNSEGTSDSKTPNIITSNQRWTIENPYQGKEIYCRAEIQLDTDGDNIPDTWTNTNGFVYSNGGFGTTATHVISDTEDYIAIRTGSIALNSFGYDTGIGLEIAPQGSAPVRVKVFSIPATKSKILYPNAEGTSDSKTPNIITSNQRWTIENPYSGKEIYCRAEIQVDTNGDNIPDTWTSTNGFVYSSGGWGTTATHVISDTEDYIAIRTGTRALNSIGYDTGMGLEIVPQTSAPVRVKVFVVGTDN